MVKCLLALAAIIAVHPAAAAELTGNDLHSSCQQSPDFCYGFAGGLVAATWPSVLTGLFCVPAESVKASQLRDVLTTYLRDHPEQRHRHFADVVGAALLDAWPCYNEESDNE